MTKREIENEILKELKAFMPKIKNVPFDRGLPLLRKEAWRLADKYDTDGARKKYFRAYENLYQAKK